MRTGYRWRVPDAEDFVRLVDRLDYPMFVVTAAAGDERAGCLVAFATQCSIHPPRFLVAISKTNETFDVARRADVVAVHFLSKRRRDLAELFGGETGDEVDKFELWEWRPGPEGVPVLTGVEGWFAGRVLERIDLGDHAGLVLEPIAAEAVPEPHPDLGFSDVKGLEPGHPP